MTTKKEIEEMISEALRGEARVFNNENFSNFIKKEIKKRTLNLDNYEVFRKLDNFIIKNSGPNYSIGCILMDKESIEKYKNDIIKLGFDIPKPLQYKSLFSIINILIKLKK